MAKVFKKDQLNYLRKALGTNKDWAQKALLKIYDNQTQDEQTSGHTYNLNGIGFTGADSEILSSFANQLITKGYLSPKQMNIVLKKMPKYTNQIFAISNITKLNNLISK